MTNRIDLSAIKKPQQKIFIENLDSKIRENFFSSTGCSYFSESGLFMNDSSISININNIEETLHISIASNTEDHLEYIEFECQSSPSIEDFAKNLIVQSLVNALATATKKFFRRNFFCYEGEQLAGEYWIRKLRISPVNPDDQNPGWYNMERYISIDMEVDAIDDQDATSIAKNFSDKIAARLSLITDTGFYRPAIQHRWVLSDDQSKPSELRQLGYTGHGPEIKYLPQKGEFCKQARFDKTMHSHMKFLGELFKLPTETRKLFTALDNAPPQVSKAFDNCAFLYQTALNAGRHSPTVKLSYLVASIEALCLSETELVDFSPFMRHYAQPTHNIDHLLNFMYGTVRSSHFHAGEFPLGEYSLQKLNMIYQDCASRQTEHYFRESKKIIRTALANWSAFLINKFENTIK